MNSVYIIGLMVVLSVLAGALKAVDNTINIKMGVGGLQLVLARSIAACVLNVGLLVVIIPLWMLASAIFPAWPVFMWPWDINPLFLTAVLINSALMVFYDGVNYQFSGQFKGLGAGIVSSIKSLGMLLIFVVTWPLTYLAFLGTLPPGYNAPLEKMLLVLGIISFVAFIIERGGRKDNAERAAELGVSREVMFKIGGVMLLATLVSAQIVALNRMSSGEIIPFDVGSLVSWAQRLNLVLCYTLVMSATVVIPLYLWLRLQDKRHGSDNIVTIKQILTTPAERISMLPKMLLIPAFWVAFIWVTQTPIKNFSWALTINPVLPFMFYRIAEQVTVTFLVKKADGTDIGRFLFALPIVLFGMLYLEGSAPLWSYGVPIALMLVLLIWQRDKLLSWR